MTDELISTGLSFSMPHRSLHADILYHAPLQTMICAAKTEYIPMESFRELFEAAIEHASVCPTRHFIFDKRTLSTFHQPSMEWYFTQWKPAASRKGIVSHYKILPHLDWFAKSVEAGKEAIYGQHGNAFLKGISIHYKQSVPEALEHIAFQSEG